MLEFVKMRALGNDFVLLDYKNALEYVSEDFTISHLAEELADRRHGVGCDQVIFYDKGDAENRVYFYNADGTEAEMCANGLRALGRLFGVLYNENSFHVKTKDRNVKITVSENEIITELGQVSFDPTMLLTTDEEEAKRLIIEKSMLESDDQSCGTEAFEKARKKFNDIFNYGVHFVHIGNPHLVLLSSNFDDFVSDEIVSELGDKLSTLCCFKNGANVSFANMVNGIIALRVWERGAGFTEACGSGACATAAAVKRLNLSDYKSPFFVCQQGGDLTIDVTENVTDGTESVTVRGEADLIFKGAIWE